VDTKINIYILFIFLKVQNFLITLTVISAPSVLSTRKNLPEIDDLRKRRRKRAAMMAHGDVMSLAYRRHEY